MNDIAKLLEAQKTDKERLTLSLSIERGSVKLELDRAMKTIADTKNTLLALESDAKTLQDNFNRIEKVLTETINTLAKAKKSGAEDIGEFGSLLSRLSILEGQLADMERKISEKTSAFKNATMAVIRSQEVVKKHTEAFEKQKASIAGKLNELKAKFDAQSQGIDEKLIAKYNAIRKQKGSDTKDVVVPVTADNRCGGCIMEIPLSQVSKISASGWAVCEECNRIIYKDGNSK